MDDRNKLEQTYRRGYWINRAILLVGAILLGTNWGVRAWIIGAGLLIYGTTWEGIMTLAVELFDRLDKLQAGLHSN